MARAKLRLDRKSLGNTAPASRFADPQDPEQHRDHDAQGDDLPTHHKPEQRDCNANGEADGPQARAGDVRGFPSGIHSRKIQTSRTRIAEPSGRRSNGVEEPLRQSGSCVSEGAYRPYSSGFSYRSMPYWAQRSSTRCAISRLIEISGGHVRAPSAGLFAVASIPIFPEMKGRVEA